MTFQDLPNLSPDAGLLSGFNEWDVVCQSLRDIRPQVGNALRHVPANAGKPADGRSAQAKSLRQCLFFVGF